MKILIVNTHLEVGGVRRALLNMLETVDTNNLNIDLFLLKHTENLQEDLKGFSNVHLYPPSFLLNIYFTSFRDLWKKNKVNIIPKILISLLVKLLGKKYTMSILMIFIKGIKGYDIAISYANDIPKKNIIMGCNDFVLKKTKAKVKIGWVHNDAYELGFTKENCSVMYNDFDVVVNVSHACKRKFDEITPEYKFKSKVVYNMFDILDVRKKSSLVSNPYNETKFNLVTVARIDNQQKRIDRIIQTCKILKSEGYTDFIWHIVGDGADLEWLKAKAILEGVDDTIKFLGNQKNPYPFMKYAHVFVLTSKYEAQGMVLTESIITGTPVIVTDYEEAREFVKNRHNGIIVGNSTDDIYLNIKEVLKDKSIIEKLRYNIQSDFVNNELALTQFAELLSEVS